MVAPDLLAAGGRGRSGRTAPSYVHPLRRAGPGPVVRDGARGLRDGDQRPAGRRSRSGAGLDQLPPPAALPDVRRHRSSLHAGANAIGGWLADGWYRGRLGFGGGHAQPCTATGRRSWPNWRSTTPTARPASSPPTARWRAAAGPDRWHRPLRGRAVRRPRWSRPAGPRRASTTAAWAACDASTVDPRPLVAPTGPPVRGTETVAPGRGQHLAVRTYASSTSGRTSPAGCGSGFAARPARWSRLRHAEVLRTASSCVATAARAPTPPTSTPCAAAASRSGSRGSPSTASATPRSRAGRASSSPATSTRSVCHTDMRAHRLVRVLRPAARTGCTRTSCGACAATSSTCRPTARSATNGSAGPATSRCSRRPRLPLRLRRHAHVVAGGPRRRAAAGTAPCRVRPVDRAAASAAPTRRGLGRRRGHRARGCSTSASATLGCCAEQYREHAGLGGPGRRARRRARLWDDGFQFGDWLDPAAPPDEPGDGAHRPVPGRHRLLRPPRQLVGRDRRRCSAATDDHRHYAALARRGARGLQRRVRHADRAAGQRRPDRLRARARSSTCCRRRRSASAPARGSPSWSRRPATASRPGSSARRWSATR